MFPTPEQLRKQAAKDAAISDAMRAAILGKYPEQLEEARKLLMQWQKYTQILEQNGLLDDTPHPNKLDNLFERTTGFLDSTSM